MSRPTTWGQIFLVEVPADIDRDAVLAEFEDHGWAPEYAVEADLPLQGLHLVNADCEVGFFDLVGEDHGLQETLREADLHAFLLREVGRYLDEQAAPVKWMWHHEEAGTWHGPDEITHRGDPDRSVLNATAPSGRNVEEPDG